MKNEILFAVLNFLRKYKIIWDNDDVLVPSGTGLIQHFNKHLNKNIPGGHYTQFQKLYGIDSIEETRLLDLFASENIAGNLLPVPGMQELLNKLLAAGCIHYVCTARPLKTYGRATRDWLTEHFSESVSLKRLSMFEGDNEQHYKFDKFPFFEKVQGDIFIDDSFHNVETISRQCKRDVLIMFQETNHNTHIKRYDLPSNVIPIPAVNQAQYIMDEIIRYDNRQRKKLIVNVEDRTFTD